VVERFEEAGVNVHMEPTAQVPIVFAVSFSMVSEGFAKVRVTDV
jgi:hypothetical protein